MLHLSSEALETLRLMFSLTSDFTFLHLPAFIFNAMLKGIITEVNHGLPASHIVETITGEHKAIE